MQRRQGRPRFGEQAAVHDISPLLGIAVETDDAGRPGCAVIEPVAAFTLHALTEWAQRRLHPQAEVFSDGLGAFRAVVPLDHAHTVIDAGGGRQATGADGARWVP